MTLAAFHDRSLGILLGGASSTITAAVTFTTAEGGFPNDFSSVKLACMKSIQVQHLPVYVLVKKYTGLLNFKVSQKHILYASTFSTSVG